MGKSFTPKYRIEMDGNRMAWRSDQAGRPTDANLEKHIMLYARSLHIGGCNEHISKAFGYIPYPRFAQVVEQATGEVKATWKAGMFQVF